MRCCMAGCGSQSWLKGARQSDFVELREALELTDGNLAAQLRKLEEHGHVRITKGYLGKRTRRP